MSSEVINLQTYYVKKAQGIANANMNVITDASGNITVGELNESSSFVDTLEKLYSDNTEHIINQSSVSNGYGRRHFDLLYTTEDDVYISCLFQQTNINNWYHGGLAVTTEEPVTETTEVNNNGGSVLITAGTGNTKSTLPETPYYGQSSSTCPFRGVEGLESNNYITFGTWYKFEVYRIGTRYTTIITNTDTGNVVLSQSKEITGNYKYWAIYAHEGCEITYKDVVINKIAISGFLANNVANIELPTKTSDLINDGEGVINKPFLTEHQDISSKANASDLAIVENKADSIHDALAQFETTVNATIKKVSCIFTAKPNSEEVEMIFDPDENFTLGIIDIPNVTNAEFHYNMVYNFSDSQNSSLPFKTTLNQLLDYADIEGQRQAFIYKNNNDEIELIMTHTDVSYLKGSIDDLIKTSSANITDGIIVDAIDYLTDQLTEQTVEQPSNELHEVTLDGYYTY